MDLLKMLIFIVIGNLVYNYFTFNMVFIIFLFFLKIISFAETISSWWNCGNNRWVYNFQVSIYFFTSLAGFKKLSSQHDMHLLEIPLLIQHKDTRVSLKLPNTVLNQARLFFII